MIDLITRCGFKRDDRVVNPLVWEGVTPMIIALVTTTSETES